MDRRYQSANTVGATVQHRLVGVPRACTIPYTGLVTPDRVKDKRKQVQKRVANERQVKYTDVSK
ncbi:MAG: hypothetical protein HUU46_18235 [Candidatus Hydrogenedentes bacterium]|nr:hypothetical protein [Candidatus Hydrogenedentota bacterium]